jgi:lipopolysaccharide biosynthesis glycosyltransferase
MNPEAPATSVCCVLASDAHFLDQAIAAINTVKRFSSAFRPTIKFIAIDLNADQIRPLVEQDIDIFTDADRFPSFAGAPKYAAALTCRPYLPEVFPGYNCYIWIDSDIRFLDDEGLRFFAAHAQNGEASIAVSQETDPAYCINCDPVKAGIYHRQKNERMFEEFGSDVARYLEYFNMYNAGLFAARADSPIWVRYKRNLLKTLRLPYSSMREQDALNVSIVEVGNQCTAPCTMNWLCSLGMPNRNGDGSWRSPDATNRKVSVAHLTNSTQPVSIEGKAASLYDYYRHIGLTE